MTTAAASDVLFEAFAVQEEVPTAVGGPEQAYSGPNLLPNPRAFRKCSRIKVSKAPLLLRYTDASLAAPPLQLFQFARASPFSSPFSSHFSPVRPAPALARGPYARFDSGFVDRLRHLWDVRCWMEGSVSPRRRSAADPNKAVCLLCRQRKVKCGKQRPSCEHCLKLGAPCHYVTDQKKPGLRAGYVSELERRLTILEQEVRELKAERRGINGEAPAHDTPVTVTEQVSPSVSSSFSTQSIQTGQPAFDPLSPVILGQLCASWFAEYQSWFPILHQPTLFRDLQSPGFLTSASTSIIFKAMALVVLPHWDNTDAVTAQQRQELSQRMRGEVVSEAMANLSLRSLQAVLILVISDWGFGHLSEAWNLIALSKRMGMQLGLRDLVAYQCKNYNKPSITAPRMLPLPSTLVDREEKIRAFWMIELLDSSSTIGASWNIGLSRPEGAGLLPCNDAIWTLPEFEVPLYSDMSSTFALTVSLVTKGLWFVHNFLQQSFDLSTSSERLRWQNECRLVDERLLTWQHEFAATQFQTTRQQYPLAEGSSPDRNILMVRTIFATAIIALYQRLALPPSDNETGGPWYHAVQRCIDSCDDMASAFLDCSDADLLGFTPYLIFNISVALRFYIVHSKTFRAPLPSNLDTLMDALHKFGKRWQFARRLEKVMRTAIDEHQLHATITSLPAQFYDLQYSTLDIDEALRSWAESKPRSVDLATFESGNPIWSYVNTPMLPVYQA